MDALVPEQAPAAQLRPIRRRYRLPRAFLRNPSFLIGVMILLTVIGFAAAAAWVFPDDPLDMAGTPTLWPGQDPAFPLGTNSLGRNVAAGLAYGARVSLLVGVTINTNWPWSGRSRWYRGRCASPSANASTPEAQFRWR